MVGCWLNSVRGRPSVRPSTAGEAMARPERAAPARIALVDPRAVISDAWWKEESVHGPGSVHHRGGWEHSRRRLLDSQPALQPRCPCAGSGSFSGTAISVDRILKGAKPTDLPVERPTKVERVINGRAHAAVSERRRRGGLAWRTVLDLA